VPAADVASSAERASDAASGAETSILVAATQYFDTCSSAAPGRPLD